ncbi:hypothetical protein RHMOL_Rhmol05G0174800 [Rhododendron molle]|uniref:Uncharacterized protein n=2 Tax=Rhododendron molle TaxID=49168 RepID=A0ACC0NQ11_RHOML|nr:hypothetical protein RHMOL_Rhmol05G0174800 [Rhododendron molle]KAI8555457.1 hypothetical protein RHMOL_Rhmol05G0174800 [Rhododendron molle]
MALCRLSSSVDKPLQRLVNGGSVYYIASLPNEAVYEKEKSRVSWPKQLNDPLEVVDSEIANIIELEKTRQLKKMQKLIGGLQSSLQQGNRLSSSACGSADVLEALGFIIDLDPELIRGCLVEHPKVLSIKTVLLGGVTMCIKEAEIGFMMAPIYHPAMKIVGPVRKKLKVKTIFNILGPMLNPSQVPYAVVGVYKEDLSLFIGGGTNPVSVLSGFDAVPLANAFNVRIMYQCNCWSSPKLKDVEDGLPKRSGKKFPNAISIHTSHAFAATCVITICKRGLVSWSKFERLDGDNMRDEIIEEGALNGRRAPSAFILYNSNEVIANLKDGGTRITNEVKRDIDQQWKKLSNEDRQKYKHLAKLAKEDLAKEKGLLPEKPKKRKLQNCISLKSIVGIVQKLSKDQRLAVELIGLGGLLHLRCTVLNHPLCNWLVKNFDPKSRSLNVHGRAFVLTVGHVHECLGINAEGKVIDLEVFYFDRVSSSPTVTSYVRKFSSLVNWGDIEIKNILHEFDNIGGYDSEGVVVNFTLDEGTKVNENTSAKEAGVSQISCGDVSVMTSTSITVASLLLRQNMILVKHFGSEMLADLEAQTAQEMDLTHGLEGAASHLLTQRTGLHTCRTSSLKPMLLC